MKHSNNLICWGDQLDEEIEKEANNTYATEGALRYVVWNNVATRIGAGASDDVEAFESADKIYVLNTNSQLRYVGLEVYTKSAAGPKRSGEIFMQNSDQIDAMMDVTPSEDSDDDGFSRFSDLELVDQVEKLMEYV